MHSLRVDDGSHSSRMWGHVAKVDISSLPLFKLSSKKGIAPGLLGSKVMPGHLATVGGMRDATDRDSSVTAVREANISRMKNAFLGNRPQSLVLGERCD